MTKAKVAIIGSGNIGTDLMIKIMRTSSHLEMGMMVGIDPNSDGLARAKRMGVETTHLGLNGLIQSKIFQDIKVVFDASSAKAHQQNFEQLKKHPTKKVIDLTPAAIGPFIVPPVNGGQLSQEQNVNMVTCGGQATIPMVAAVSAVAQVYYGEIVASIASKSAGPGTRANIDEFTETTANAIETVGGAEKGKAIIILNPAEPPLVMRDTVFTLSEIVNTDFIEESVNKMVEKVQQYVPGYRLHHAVQFDEIKEAEAIQIPGLGKRFGLKTSILLEVTGAGHYLPEYAGNLDIMTSAALAVGEQIIKK